MTQLHKITVMLLAVGMFTACSKKDSSSSTVQPGNNNNPQQPALKEQEKFLVGSWAFEKAIDTLWPKNTPTTYTVKEGIITCKMDDTYNLRADKKYTKDEGKDSCTANALYREENWALDDYGGITFADGPNPSSFANRFIKIDDRHFAIAYSNQDWQGNRTLVYYFKKK